MGSDSKCPINYWKAYSWLVGDFVLHWVAIVTSSILLKGFEWGNSLHSSQRVRFSSFCTTINFGGTCSGLACYFTALSTRKRKGEREMMRDRLLHNYVECKRRKWLRYLAIYISDDLYGELADPIWFSNCIYSSQSTGQSFCTSIPRHRPTTSTYLPTIIYLGQQRTARQLLCTHSQNITQTLLPRKIDF